VLDQLGHVEHWPYTSKNLAHFTIGRGQFLKGLGLFELQLPHLVKGEPIQQGGVVLGAAHLKELPFEALIGLLEEREEDSPCHATKAHPEVFPGALSFKEMKEDVDGRGVSKVVA